MPMICRSLLEITEGAFTAGLFQRHDGVKERLSAPFMTIPRIEVLVDIRPMGTSKPGMRKLWWMLTPGSVEAKEKKWREVDGKKKASLLWAMNDSVKWWFWTSALLKIISDVAQVTSPLVVRVRL